MKEMKIHSYHAKTASGGTEEVLFQSSSPLPVQQQVQDFSYDYHPITGEDIPVHGKIKILPHLNCFPMDHPALIEEIQEMIYPPSTEDYNFQELEKNIHGETGHPDDVDRIVFGGQLKNGFFIEAGSVDSETFSNTLYFEINHGWTGLLVEPMPIHFTVGLEKHRKAYSIQTCFSTDLKAQIVDFDPEATVRDEESQELRSMGGIVKDTTSSDITMKVQCLPFYSVLMALGNKTVNWFSLDIEGAEFAVLRTIPWDKVNIEVITVETHLMGKIFPGDREEFLEYMKSVGYDHITDGHSTTNPLREAWGTIDDMFVKKGVPLAKQRLNLNNNKDEL